jgi:glycosyltransferase involved in cell wall biosynthesis
MSNPPARILWLTKGLGRGGMEVLLTAFAERVDRDRFDVEVAFMVPEQSALVQQIRAAGLTVHCLGQASNRDFRWAWRLRKLIRDRAYDIVHSHSPLPAVAARLIRVPSSQPQPVLIHTEHNIWDSYRRPTYWSNAWTLRSNAKVIAVSQAVADSIRASCLRDPSTLEVIRHGVDLTAIPRQPHARETARGLLGLPMDSLVVGTVGNLTPKKDHRGLLDAFALLHGRRPDARLVIIGGGPLEGELRRHAAALGVANSVHLTGARTDVIDLLPGLDIFAMSSLFEGLSIALVEALAMGLPAAATRVGGMPEVIRNGIEGLLVPPSDPVLMAGALYQIASNAALREGMSTAGVKRARQFDLGVAWLRLENIYDELLIAS